MLIWYLIAKSIDINIQNWDARALETGLDRTQTRACARSNLQTSMHRHYNLIAKSTDMNRKIWNVCVRARVGLGCTQTQTCALVKFEISMHRHYNLIAKSTDMNRKIWNVCVRARVRLGCTQTRACARLMSMHKPCINKNLDSFINRNIFVFFIKQSSFLLMRVYKNNALNWHERNVFVQLILLCWLKLRSVLYVAWHKKLDRFIKNTNFFIYKTV